VCRARNLTVICEPIIKNTFHKPMGLHGLSEGYFIQECCKPKRAKIVHDDSVNCKIISIHPSQCNTRNNPERSWIETRPCFLFLYINIKNYFQGFASCCVYDLGFFSQYMWQCSAQLHSLPQNIVSCLRIRDVRKHE
jgi:hypothetical protein